MRQRLMATTLGLPLPQEIHTWPYCGSPSFRDAPLSLGPIEPISRVIRGLGRLGAHGNEGSPHSLSHEHNEIAFGVGRFGRFPFCTHKVPLVSFNGHEWSNDLECMGRTLTFLLSHTTYPID